MAGRTGLSSHDVSLVWSGRVFYKTKRRTPISRSCRYWCELHRESSFHPRELKLFTYGKTGSNVNNLADTIHLITDEILKVTSGLTNGAHPTFKIMTIKTNYIFTTETPEQAKDWSTVLQTELFGPPHKGAVYQFMVKLLQNSTSQEYGIKGHYLLKVFDDMVRLYTPNGQIPLQFSPLIQNVVKVSSHSLDYKNGCKVHVLILNIYTNKTGGELMAFQTESAGDAMRIISHRRKTLLDSLSSKDQPDQQSPVVKEQSPVVKEQSPVVKEQSPVVKEQSPVVKNVVKLLQQQPVRKGDVRLSATSFLNPSSNRKAKSEACKKDANLLSAYKNFPDKMRTTLATVAVPANACNHQPSFQDSAPKKVPLQPNKDSKSKVPDSLASIFKPASPNSIQGASIDSSQHEVPNTTSNSPNTLRNRPPAPLPRTPSDTEPLLYHTTVQHKEPLYSEQTPKGIQLGSKVEMSLDDSQSSSCSSDEEMNGSSMPLQLVHLSHKEDIAGKSSSAHGDTAGSTCTVAAAPTTNDDTRSTNFQKTPQPMLMDDNDDEYYVIDSLEETGSSYLQVLPPSLDDVYSVPRRSSFGGEWSLREQWTRSFNDPKLMHQSSLPTESTASADDMVATEATGFYNTVRRPLSWNPTAISSKSKISSKAKVKKRPLSTCKRPSSELLPRTSSLDSLLTSDTLSVQPANSFRCRSCSESALQYNFDEGDDGYVIEFLEEPDNSYLKLLPPSSDQVYRYHDANRPASYSEDTNHSDNELMLPSVGEQHLRRFKEMYHKKLHVATDLPQQQNNEELEMNEGSSNREAKPQENDGHSERRIKPKVAPKPKKPKKQSEPCLSNSQPVDILTQL